MKIERNADHQVTEHLREENYTRNKQ